MTEYSHDEGTDYVRIASGEAVGVKIDSSHGAVTGSEKLDGEISFYYKSRDSSSLCTGTVTFGLYNSDTGALIDTVGTHTFTDLQHTTYTKQTTTGTGSTTITVDHAVGISYSGTGVLDIYKHVSNNYPDGRFWQYDGSSTTVDANSDARFIFNASASSGGGSGGGGSGGGGSSEGDAPTGDGLPQTERLQILSTVIPR